MSESEIIKVYNEGIQSVVTLVQGLSSQISDLSQEVSKQSETISDLDARLKALENKTKLTSKNSSLPPSTDGFKRTKSLRQSSSKKPGGQEGHKGTTLKMVLNPDEICIHDIELCQDCGCSLIKITPSKIIKRQVFDLPKLSLKAIEHPALVKFCPNCSRENKGFFPKEVTQSTQYGTRFKSILVYLSQQHLIPYDRLKMLASDVFGQSLSAGTLVNMNNQCFKALEKTEQLIKEKLIQSHVVHLDETGCYVNGDRHWLHVVSNPKYTYYQVHEKRGNEAIKDIKVLSQYKGTAVHDHWKSYFRYQDCSHALCNVHHLRELNAMIEFEKQEWPKQMKQLLLDMKEYSESYQYPLSQEAISQFELRYQTILTLGYLENPISLPKEKKRGRLKQTKAINLLNRLRDCQEEVLEFMYQKDLPFDNNLAERDVRMTKVKQKISGCFRSEEGAQVFCRVRGYISTARKQSLNILESIEQVFLGEPSLT